MAAAEVGALLREGTKQRPVKVLTKRVKTQTRKDSSRSDYKGADDVYTASTEAELPLVLRSVWTGARE